MSESLQTAAVAVESPFISSAPTAAAVAEAPLFTEQQIDQFDADDGDAGRAIGRMLASFFLYTVIVMSLVAWWTLTRPTSKPVTNAATQVENAAHAEH
jgi:hypothetical protein